MKTNLLFYPFGIMMAVLLMFAISCSKDDNTNPPVPVLTTTAVTSVTSNTATSGGNITSDGGTDVTIRGVCWSKGNTPTISDSKTTNGTGTGTFTSNIYGLIPNTTYYVRAYATNSAGTGYGNALSVTTSPELTVTDIDGNVYHTVTIGTQTWMVENLKVTKYRNGSTIPNVTDNTAWSNLTTGACCDYNNIASNSITYGKLYNWYAVNDSNNIAPTGWHVPTDAEWTILTTYLGGETVAGGKLKEAGKTHWDISTDATNESGFTALPGGYRINSNGAFLFIRSAGYWWSSGIDPVIRHLNYDYSYVDKFNSYNKQVGYSVRCVKD